MHNVAVVTPVFNTQDYLHRCIRSILSQDGVDLQLILIDDGSTDNSSNIIKHYQEHDSRVTLLSKQNGGQGIARNLGIKLAEAEFIYFVDSDDHLGEGTLRRLYEAAKRENLDLCSPDVPYHYFAPPLEHIPCVPCKSQFIKASIIRDFNIFQPDVRSGQDGVFSHLVLTHCDRIGMLTDAKFHYTHAREGSTFAKHQKRPDLVASIVKKHYDAIEAHYDAYDLWEKNAPRFLWFISTETIRNRLSPHFKSLTLEQRRSVLELLTRNVKKALGYLSKDARNLVPPLMLALGELDIEYLCSDEFGEQLSNDKPAVRFPKNDNYKRDNLTICKIEDEKYRPVKTASVARLVLGGRPADEKSETFQPAASVAPPRSGEDARALMSKLDFIINTINNTATQLKVSQNAPASDLSNGLDDLVASVTTLPSRLPLVHFAIESIFSQTVKPGKVVLWISDKIDPSLVETPELESLVSRGLMIRFVEDVGPHTKLIPALMAFPERNVVTFDDDIVYPVNMIQTLWKEHERHPNAVIANWARELAFDADGKVQGVRSGKLLTPPNLDKDIEQACRYESEPTLLGFPYGTSGVLYPPNALHEKVFNVAAFRELCPKEDDIWFRAMGIMNRTPVVPTNLGIDPKHHCVFGSQAEALRHDNHGLQQNKVQMQRVFEALDLYKYINHGLHQKKVQMQRFFEAMNLYKKR